MNQDGKGQNMPKGKSPQDSVDVGVRTDVPGGESKSGGGAKLEGPNSAKKK